LWRGFATINICTTSQERPIVLGCFNMIELIKSTLLESGELFYQHEPKIVKTKKEGGANWITVEDVILESLILARIKEKYPNHVTLSEEDDVLPKSPNNLENLWIIDPLDGTTNAVFGFPHFGIAIAYMQKGDVKCGGIYDLPNRTLFWAEKGKGAFKQSKNDKSPQKIHVREGLLKNALTCVGSPYLYNNFKTLSNIMVKIYKKGARFINTGSTISDVLLVSQGKLSLYYDKGIEPWDIAAASLIVRESGGVAMNFEGKLDIFGLDSFVCGNKEIVKEFLKLV